MLSVARIADDLVEFVGGATGSQTQAVAGGGGATGSRDSDRAGNDMVIVPLPTASGPPSLINRKPIISSAGTAGPPLVHLDHTFMEQGSDGPTEIPKSSLDLPRPAADITPRKHDSQVKRIEDCGEDGDPRKSMGRRAFLKHLDTVESRRFAMEEARFLCKYLHPSVSVRRLDAVWSQMDKFFVNDDEYKFSRACCGAQRWRLFPGRWQNVLTNFWPGAGSLRSMQVILLQITLCPPSQRTENLQVMVDAVQNLNGFLMFVCFGLVSINAQIPGAAYMGGGGTGRRKSTPVPGKGTKSDAGDTTTAGAISEVNVAAGLCGEVGCNEVAITLLSVLGTLFFFTSTMMAYPCLHHIRMTNTQDADSFPYTGAARQLRVARYVELC